MILSCMKLNMLSQKVILLRNLPNDISFGLFSSDNDSINNPEKEEFDLNDNHIDEENITKPNDDSKNQNLIMLIKKMRLISMIFKTQNLVILRTMRFSLLN